MRIYKEKTDYKTIFSNEHMEQIVKHYAMVISDGG